MAASASKPDSPTNRPVVEGSTTTATSGDGGCTDTKNINNTESSATAAAAAASVEAKVEEKETNAIEAATTSLPTYKSVEESKSFALAKDHLKQDDFEAALELIAKEIQANAELLDQKHNIAQDDIFLHESMAPWHYLYGTTLLYSIEESTDNQMTVPTTEQQQPQEDEEQDDGPEVDKSAAAADDGAAEGAAPADNADDMEIAWENLETARSIVEKMLQSIDAEKEKYQLDLAQIFLREGDLQRMNGRYETALEDYQSCLDLRVKGSLGVLYSRQVADTHYNMALTYMLKGADASNATDEDGNPTTCAPNEEQKQQDRNKGVYHYWACSKHLCGHIATLCDISADTILEGKHYKTTGEEETAAEDTSTTKDDSMVPNVAAQKLTLWRQRVRALQPPADKKDTVHDLCELLDEIQETIEEAEVSTKGVQEVSEMKAAVKAAAAGETTTAGTAASSLASLVPTTTIGFGSASATAATAAATAASSTEQQAKPVMMVVKKKKKREASQLATSATSSNVSDNPSEQKRTKTSNE